MLLPLRVAAAPQQSICHPPKTVSNLVGSAGMKRIQGYAAEDETMPHVFRYWMSDEHADASTDRSGISRGS